MTLVSEWHQHTPKKKNFKFSQKDSNVRPSDWYFGRSTTEEL